MPDSYEQRPGEWTDPSTAPPSASEDEWVEDPNVDGEWSEDDTPPQLKAPPFERMSAQDMVDAAAVTGFPEEWRNDFEGLAYLGYLEDVVVIPAHRFVIRTLLPAAKLEVSLICKEFEGTLGYNRAYKAAVCAASIVEVDGIPIGAPQKQVGIVRQKYEYVINSWYDPVIDLVYGRVDRLEGRQYEVMKELGMFAGEGEGKGGS